MDQSMKHISGRDSAGFSGGSGFPPARIVVAHRATHLGEDENLRPSSIEMKVWTVLFALVLLATITLIVVVMMEEPAPKHAALSCPSWSVGSWLATPL